jgi:hypothetical protein
MPAAPSFRVRLTSAAPEARMQDYLSALATVADRIDTISVRQEEAKTITYLFECMARSGQDISCVFDSIRMVSGTEEINISILQRGRGSDTEG